MDVPTQFLCKVKTFLHNVLDLEANISLTVRLLLVIQSTQQNCIWMLLVAYMSSPWILVCKQTILIEQPLLVGEVRANFCG
jgi:hypothetical protein